MNETNLEQQLHTALDELQIEGSNRSDIISFSSILKKEHPYTYEHSLRVALLARRIAKYLHLDEKALFYVGLFHDLGKFKVSKRILDKKSRWTEDDMLSIQKHVIEAYNMLKGRFDFTAEVIIWHHKFQSIPYPKEMPVLLHNYSKKTKNLIKEYGRLLAIADVYDALHRKNLYYGKNRYLNDAKIKETMLQSNPDRLKLIKDLYEVGIFR